MLVPHGVGEGSLVDVALLVDAIASPLGILSIGLSGGLVMFGMFPV